MKFNLFIICYFCTSILMAQTIEVELVAIAKQYQNEKISIIKYRSVVKDWNDFNNNNTNNISYPKFPYDETLNKFVFSNIIELKSLSKLVIYKRILEWVATNYGSLSSVMHYSDKESGKIIVKGWFPITYQKDEYNFWGNIKELTSVESSKCFHTIIYTIKDFKCKIDVVDVNYECKYHYAISTGGFKSYHYKMDLYSLFPIILKDKIEWKGILNLVNETDKKITAYNKSLQKYILDFESDYQF